MKHNAYADPIDGGWTGYQGACWDCDWRGEVRPSHEDGKLLAQEDAAAHRAEAPPVVLRCSCAREPFTDEIVRVVDTCPVHGGPVDVSRLHSGW